MINMRNHSTKVTIRCSYIGPKNKIELVSIALMPNSHSHSTGDIYGAICIPKGPAAQLAVALHRAGLSSDSMPYRFLSFFKIFNMFWQDKYLKQNGKRKHELKEGLTKLLSEEGVREWMEKYYQTDKSPVELVDYLHGSGRCAIAHAYGKKIVDPDVFSETWRLSADLELVRYLAVKLIKERFNIVQYLFA